VLDIKEWLKEFKLRWLEADIDSILDLFTDDVEYWETPHKRLASKQEIKDEWAVINSQNKKKLFLKEFSSNNGKHTVLWSLKYEDNKGSHNWAGTYLLELNENGQCNYFHQTGEVE